MNEPGWIEVPAIWEVIPVECVRRIKPIVERKERVCRRKARFGEGV